MTKLTKREFIRKYKALTPIQQEEIKQYYIDIYEGAIFYETYAAAEKRLEWIMEADND